MSRPWMPLYVADYLADTRHLGGLEHGAYLLLLMHYWQTGGLPDDDTQLSRIACATPGEWRKIRGVIAGFFEPGWKHGRVEAELQKAREISAKRRGAAEDMHSNRIAKAHANAEQVQTQPLTPSQSHVSNLFSAVKEKREGWTPPKHGATSKAKGRVYVREGTSEWSAYADDYRAAHGEEPTSNAYGGRWFNIAGEPIKSGRTA